MIRLAKSIWIVALVFHCFIAPAIACSNKYCKVKEKCEWNGDCDEGLYCFSCHINTHDSICVRSAFTNQFKLLNNSLPFNKYAYLTTHNSFAISGEPSHTGYPRVTFSNQEDSITEQLNNGVRALMLDTYEYEKDVWLCHSFGGKCHRFTAFGPAIDSLREIESFLLKNPLEIITLILEDHVKTTNMLSKVFDASGLRKYWFPVSQMPRNGQDWPLVKQMVANNQRLIVFTSNESKQASEGIAYQWNYMVESKYGDEGLDFRECRNRKDSAPLDDKNKALVLVNYFESIPTKRLSCESNSEYLIDMLHTCYKAGGNRWANFVAVDFYKRSDGGGAFQAVDMLNGKLLCGRNDIHACVPGK